MSHIARRVGWALLLIGGGLIVIGFLVGPPGGLMFALPFVFILPGLVFVGTGIALVLLGRARKPRRTDTPT